MAEGILKKMLKDKNITDIKVCSSGIYANTGEYATDEAIQAVKELYDVNILNHRATNIRDSKIKEMDLILCATHAHKTMVMHLYPELKEKVYTMKEYADKNAKDIDISDPWGYPMNVYRKCAEEIYKTIELIIHFIL